MLVALGVWMGTTSERLPYRFMHGAKRWYSQLEPSPPLTGVYSETYVLDRPTLEVSRDAIRELGLPQFDWGEGETTFMGPDSRPDVFIGKALDVRQVVSSGEPPPLPRSTRTLVTICHREHTMWTRIRAWFADLEVTRP